MRNNGFSLNHFLKSISRTQKGERKFIIIDSNLLLNKCVKKSS